MLELIDGKETAIFTIGGSILTFLFGAWDVPLQILCVAVLLDYFSGMLKAFYLGDVSSRVGYRGLIKKVGIFFAIVVAQMADTILGMFIFRSAICLFFSANELISVLENVGSMGIPIPKPLKDKLIQIKSTNEDKTDDKQENRE